MRKPLTVSPDDWLSCIFNFINNFGCSVLIFKKFEWYFLVKKILGEKVALQAVFSSYPGKC